MKRIQINGATYNMTEEADTIGISREALQKPGVTERTFSILKVLLIDDKLYIKVTDPSVTPDNSALKRNGEVVAINVQHEMNMGDLVLTK